MRGPSRARLVAPITANPSARAALWARAAPSARAALWSGAALLSGALASGALLPAAACGPCEQEGPRVPFGIDAGRGVGPGRAARTPEDDFTPVEGQALPDGTRSVAIEGAPIAVERGSIRSLLALDLDGDGDRDAILLVALEGAAVRLLHAIREGAGFLPAREVALSSPWGAACGVGAAGLRTIAPGLALALVDVRCDADETREAWVLSVEAEPRLREHIALMPPRGRSQGALSMSVQTGDHDEDGHTDLVLDVEVTPEGGEGAASVSIAWLDRPGGLARDTGEPEAAISALARRAERALGADPAAALADARRALALHAVLCREGGAPRVRFGDADGLSCGPSQGAGTAAAIATAALARTGRVFEALAAAEALQSPAHRVTAAARRTAERALEQLPSPAVRRREGPEVRTPSAAGARLSLVGFLGSDRLLVRGDAPRVLDLATLEPLAGDPQGGVAVLDPSGALAVAAVGRTCEGYVLRIVRASQLVAGVVAGEPVHEALVEGVAPPPSARCPDLPDGVRAATGGHLVLGWAPQGVVVARRDEVRLVPLTVDGAAAGPPQRLGDGTPLPVPLPPGAISADARAYATITRWGIVVRTLLPAPAVTVLRPEGWDAARVTDVAVSPDGATVAYVSAGRLFVLDRP